MKPNIQFKYNVYVRLNNKKLAKTFIVLMQSNHSEQPSEASSNILF